MTNDNAMTPVSPASLTRWVLQQEQANEAVQLARMQIARGLDLGDGKSVDDRLFEAQELTEATRSEIYSLAPLLPVDTTDLSAQAAAIPLHQLDTADTRRLLELLEEAQSVAELIDAARGRVLPPHIPLQPGESRGTDLAESISYLALRVRTEIYGPADRQQE